MLDDRRQGDLHEIRIIRHPRVAVRVQSEMDTSSKDVYLSGKFCCAVTCRNCKMAHRELLLFRGIT
jgi:hypothetical protein